MSKEKGENKEETRTPPQNLSLVCFHNSTSSSSLPVLGLRMETSALFEDSQNSQLGCVCVRNNFPRQKTINNSLSLSLVVHHNPWLRTWCSFPTGVLVSFSLSNPYMERGTHPLFVPLPPSSSNHPIPLPQPLTLPSFSVVSIIGKLLHVTQLLIKPLYAMIITVRVFSFFLSSIDI